MLATSGDSLGLQYGAELAHARLARARATACSASTIDDASCGKAAAEAAAVASEKRAAKIKAEYLLRRICLFSIQSFVSRNGNWTAVTVALAINRLIYRFVGAGTRTIGSARTVVVSKNGLFEPFIY